MSVAARQLRSGVGVLLVAGLAAGAAHGQQGTQNFAGETREGGREEDFRRASPSRIVAAELAFARAAQELGQWTAFAEYAARDAVMFVPEPVRAQDWLRKRANPPQAVRWQPHQVWASCDGSLAVTRGAWQRPDGSVGYFTTVWQRQEKEKDGYRWVLDQGDALAAPLAAPEMIEAKVAECPRPMQHDAVILDPPACTAQGCSGGGRSGDDTLEFRYETRPDGARAFRVSMMVDGRMEEVLLSEVAAG